MQYQASPPKALSRPPTERGRATRTAILDGALAVIAERGIHAVTHRAIAAQAGVALASTTYFFASLPQLLLEAFDHYVAQSQPATDAILAQAAALVRAHAAPEQSRAQLQAKLTDLIVAFMRRQMRHPAQCQAVEVQFLHLAAPDAMLADAIRAYRRGLVDGVARALEPLGGAQAAVDASLLLGTIHRFDADGHRGGNLPEAEARAEIGRLLALMLQ